MKPVDVGFPRIQERPDKNSPFIVRCWVGHSGNEGTWSFRAWTPADRYRAKLMAADARGEKFDPETHQPYSWAPVPEPEPALTVASWAVTWYVSEWGASAQRTRKSRAEALARFMLLAVAGDAPPSPARPEGPEFLADGETPRVPVARGERELIYELMNNAANRALGGGVGSDGADWDSEIGRWLTRWSLPLDALDWEACVRISAGLGLGDLGQAVKSSARYVKVSRQCLAAAVEADHLSAQPWKARKKVTYRKTKAKTKRKAINPTLLPATGTVGDILAGMLSHQPASLRYQRMTATIYLTGRRPSEVMDLCVEDLTFPDDPTDPTACGEIRVCHSDQRAGAAYRDLDDDDTGDTKTGSDRTVPMHPLAVVVLRLAAEAAGSGPLWVTRTGGRPSPSNWTRSWQRGCAGRKHRLYDLRHCHATTLLGGGMPLGDVADRLGHTVETLVSVYARVLEGDRATGNRLMLHLFGPLPGETPDPASDG